MREKLFWLNEFACSVVIFCMLTCLTYTIITLKAKHIAFPCRFIKTEIIDVASNRSLSCIFSKSVNSFIKFRISKHQLFRKLQVSFAAPLIIQKGFLIAKIWSRDHHCEMAYHLQAAIQSDRVFSRIARSAWVQFRGIAMLVEEHEAIRLENVHCFQTYC